MVSPLGGLWLPDEEFPPWLPEEEEEFPLPSDVVPEIECARPGLEPLAVARLVPNDENPGIAALAHVRLASWACAT